MAGALAMAATMRQRKCHVLHVNFGLTLLASMPKQEDQHNAVIMRWGMRRSSCPACFAKLDGPWAMSCRGCSCQGEWIEMISSAVLSH